MVEEDKKTHTRFIYAAGATLLTFAYLFATDSPDASAAFTFLSFVAGGFGLSKATQHLKVK